MPVIAIGSLEGGGGVELGRAVAQKLGADYVDRLILAEAARHAGATVEALHQREERPPTRGERFARFLQRVLERSAMSGAGTDFYFGSGDVPFLTREYEELPQPLVTRGHELEDEKYIEAIRKVMMDLAARGNVVIVGRGSSVILKDNPNVLRVGAVSRFEDRVARVMERTRLNRQQAEQIVAARDKARAYYFKRFFNISNTVDAELFHLTINVSQVGLEYATNLVVQAAADLENGTLRR
jgi:cytidylate kinase